jgi:SagB-type dehydrogenase family enzyme
MAQTSGEQPAGKEGSADDDRLMCETVFAYHERTKHHFQRYARSLGYMDWATQPHPFRYYEGSLQTQLNLNRTPRPLAYDQLYEGNPLSPKPVDLDSLADFFRYSLALSAWKQSGSSRWALRINPSSGNLHPTEAYAVLPPLSGVSATPALYHYLSESHVLERRASFTDDVWRSLTKSLPEGSFLVGLSSAIWREAWKYGERAFRYCQHDVGHAVAALRFAAIFSGWTFRLVSNWSTEDIAQLLGVNRADEFCEDELEEAELLAVVTPNTSNEASGPSLPSPDDTTMQLIREADWYGRPNQLSGSHVCWPVIEEVAIATKMPRAAAPIESSPLDHERSAHTRSSSSLDARQIISHRRSCLALDGVSEISREQFIRMLARTLPRPYSPWDALYWTPKIHLLLFVHRVAGLQPGVYILVRDQTQTDVLRSACDTKLMWQTPAGVPLDLPLYLLADADCRESARALSCQQDIAADGFFSLGMLAEFAEPIQQRGPSFYRNLFWEAGVIGQVLYLEAEAASARSTGIGCFFDDAVHDVLGLTDNQFQSLYHFTVGMPVEDGRLQTWPPYGSDA